MMRPSAPERDAESQWAEENEENEEPLSGSFSKKTPPKKTTISDWQNDYTFRLVLAPIKRAIQKGLMPEIGFKLGGSRSYLLPITSCRTWCNLSGVSSLSW